MVYDLLSIIANFHTDTGLVSIIFRTILLKIRFYLRGFYFLADCVQPINLLPGFATLTPVGP
jgi:hypothetical protein